MVYTQDGQSVYVTDNPIDVQDGQRALPLYPTPPQRPWVGLTDEEIDHAAEQSDNYASFTAGALFAQDKLEEKNT